MKRITVFSLVMVFVLVFAACAPQATPEPTQVPTAIPTPVVEPTAMPEDEVGTIVDIAAADGRFTTLVAAVTAAGLVDTLQGPGPFTVFAPTDEAFAKLPAGTVEALLADVPTLNNVLLYHVTSGNLMAADVLASDEIEMAQGSVAMISMDGSNALINDAIILITDIEASNGIIHVIDTVILPPAEETAEVLPSIVEIAVADGRFETLVAAVGAAGLVDTLSGEGPFTVFAPTDDAFAALPAGTIEALLADIPALTDILLYHVVSGKVMASDVVELIYADTVLGQPILVKVVDGNVFINDAQVVLTDIEASNGVIHVVDAVILPADKDIVATAIEDGRFTTLVAAIQAADLVDALQSDGPLTVFAPTDEAFAALPAGTLESLLNDIPALTSILLYHVVDGNVFAGQVVDLDRAETLQGSEIKITIEADGSVKINDATVLITDILTSNGVIHVIDAVILPMG
jgi:transforming growth factor-beta-induced protein